VTKRSLATLLWTGFLLFCIVLFAWTVRTGFSLETDLLGLFPSDSDYRVLELSTKMMEKDSARKILFTIKSSGSDEGIREKVVSHLEQSSLFEVVLATGSDDSRRAFFDFYFPHRYQILSPEVRQRLKRDSAPSDLIQRVKDYLYGYASSFVSRLLPRDPLLVFPGLLEYWGREMGRAGTDVSTGGRVVAQLNGSPYNPTIQRRFYDLIETVRNNNPNVTVKWTGVLRFATKIRRRMHRDLRLISILSTTAVILLLLLTFRSLKHLFVLIVTLAISIMTAVVALVWLFPNPHFFTIVFSTSLIGVSVDYAFHFFTETVYADVDQSGWQSLTNILPGLTLGMITTVIGYLGLTLTPLPILKQMALFSSVGILVAFGTVLFWYPYIFSSDAAGSRVIWFHTVAGEFYRGWGYLLSSSYRLTALGCLCLIILAGGWTTLSFNDNVRHFQNVPRSVMERDRRIREETGQWNTGRFILIEGADPQSLLNRQEQVVSDLAGLSRANVMGDFRSLVPFLPSRERQKRNFNMIKETVLSSRQTLLSGLTKLGIPETSVRTLFSDLRTGPKSFITPDAWLKSPVSFGLRSLWIGETGHGFSSLVLLRNIHDENRLKSAFAGNDNVHYRNRLQQLNELLANYRREAMYYAGIAYLVILGVLVFRYGLPGGIVTSIPSVLGGALTISVLSLTGMAFNVTHVLALLLVLGIGIDYAVFLREAVERDRNIHATLVAIILSACSTISSFGFLGLSQAKMLESIGLTVFVGILFVLLLAPVVRFDSREKTNV
jgi:predicted exporter